MKRLWIALVCILISAVLCTFEIIYTYNSTDYLNNMVAKAKTQLNSGKGVLAASTLNEARDFWQGRKGVTSVFLHHDRIDDIDVQLLSAAYACEKADADSEIKLIQLQIQLGQIWSMERPTIENIL